MRADEIVLADNLLVFDCGLSGACCISGVWKRGVTPGIVKDRNGSGTVQVYFLYGQEQKETRLELKR